MSKSLSRRTAAITASLSLLASAVLVVPAVVSPTALAAPTVVAAPADGGVTTTKRPSPTPKTDHCPQKTDTPPAVDESEVVAPGETTPTPLPVPTEPIGGERLGGCGAVHDPAAGPLPKRLTSAGWLIADMDSGRVIAAKDPHGRYRPASTIKVLLALVALEELDLDQSVESTANDWSMEGDSCGMGPDGDYTVRDLLSGLIVVSGNDCANALARLLGGYDETLEKMNKKAAELGAKDTRAATPSGLDSAGMSTSPYDLALLFREAMRNETFRQIAALKTYKFPGYPARKDVPGDEDHPAWTMGTSNALLRDDWPGMLGGKTGFTDDALKTFVGAAERDGRTVVIVQMYGLSEEDNGYFAQAQRMFEYGFAAPATTSVGTLAVAEQVDPDSGETRTVAESELAHDESSSLGPWVIGFVVVAAACLAAAAVLWRKRTR
ncbi:D-alanyl-D-alanine carboxypeptidase family protein [Gordonia sp. (in: high G+C Gram-positive bacteria)]|uniref:D-alanyl-D-alanine carboxypeptidase family protein n=1 Tax=Gordonia sp. (in: high G+C Gram-positive bacteria) TaxID=84139 RepID=UPI0016955933|nr:serine hydrolase [Gordonia sp. (in: high G+C Gram-positive bacteria)]NLG45815.1 D-alanyl-D-alanine carboxypeptidase [Gordonia sp. (in: high G+C Gram-positive bacteria)]